MPTTTSQVQQRLRDYLDGALSYEDFWAWLLAARGDHALSPLEQTFLYQIIGRFYEYDAGAWDDDQLFLRLEELALDRRFMQQRAEVPAPRLTFTTYRIALNIANPYRLIHDRFIQSSNLGKGSRVYLDINIPIQKLDLQEYPQGFAVSSNLKKGRGHLDPVYSPVHLAPRIEFPEVGE